MSDQHKNFSYSTVATAPSPATSGTSLVVATGDGAKFPTVPFNATVWPVSAQPTTANAEIVRVTAISTDTLTITRAQEGTTARTVVVGDQIAATVTAKTLTDVELNVYVTDQDKTIPATTEVIFETHLELAASFFYELSTDAILVIGDFGTPQPPPDQNTNIFVTVNDETVPPNSEVVFSDFYELSMPFVVEVLGGGLVQVGTTPDVAPLLPQDGWVSDSSEAWIYVSATSFQINGVDLTAKYTKGTRLKLTDGGTKYFVVASSAFSTNTTVTITGGSDYSLSGGIISNPSHSYAVNPQGYPGWFNFTASPTGFSGTPTTNTAIFSVVGNTCYLKIDVTGTSSATTAGFTAPISTTAQANNDMPMLAGTNNSVSLAAMGLAYLAGAGTVWGVFQTPAGAAWTASGTKAFRVMGYFQF